MKHNGQNGWNLIPSILCQRNKWTPLW